MRSLFLIISVISAFSLISCESSTQKNQLNSGKGELIKYAKKLSIIEKVDHYLITINGTKKKYNFLAKPESTTIDTDELTIEIPINEIIVSSTSHIPALDYLNVENSLIGFPQTKWIYNSNMRRKVDQSKITEVGLKNSLDIEKLINLNPDVLMLYDERNYNEVLRNIEGHKPTKILNIDYLEQHPLGRAEWIKLFGILYDKKSKADSIFQGIEDEYNRLKSLTDTVSKYPTVISGSIYGDTWYMPGGKSWVARFIEDAGGNYLWSDSNESGSLKLGYENVLSKGSKAEYWIGASNFNTIKELTETDRRYQNFKAVQQHKVYTYTKQQIENGGNNYLELGYLRPDYVLSDYIKILHPELMKDSEFIFFNRL